MMYCFTLNTVFPCMQIICFGSTSTFRWFSCVYLNFLWNIGYYCTSGVDRPKPGASNDTTTANCTCPDQTYFTGVGGVCPVGHYCPQGSPSPVPCAAGTYADTVGQSMCWTCPQGYYCLANSTDFLSSPCPVGEGLSNSVSLFQYLQW